VKSPGKTHIPFTMIDAEGEYSGSKEKYEVIWIGERRGVRPKVERS